MIEAVEQELDAATIVRERRISRISTFLAVTTALGAGTATVAQFLVVDRLPEWGYVGIVGAIVSVILALSSILLNSGDVHKQLLIARRAVGASKTSENQKIQAIEVVDQIQWALELKGNLVSTLQVMRDSLENFLGNNTRDVETLCQDLLRLPQAYLAQAAGFEIEHDWTVTVFKAEKQSDGIWLRPIAAIRASDCDLTNARSWPSGKGIAGRAFANKHEMIISDLHHDPEAEAVKQQKLDRPHDAKRYRALIGIPLVIVGQSGEPWGALCASSNQPGHFNVGNDALTDWADSVRAVAKMVELGVAMTLTVAKEPARKSRAKPGNQGVNEGLGC